MVPNLARAGSVLLGLLILASPARPQVTEPQIFTTAVPNGIVGSPYQFQFAGTTGTWTIIAGQLPPGLQLSAAGLLLGTPQQAGIFIYRVRLIRFLDGVVAGTADQTFNHTIIDQPGQPGLIITTQNIPDATVGIPYVFLFEGSGVPPLVWSVLAGVLPRGIVLAGDGRLLGTPEVQGVFEFTIQVRDGLQRTSQRIFQIRVRPRLTIQPQCPLSETIPGPYNQNVTATGGTPPLLWRLSGGSLPPGVLLTPTGILFGVTTLPGLFEYTIEVSDAAGNTDTKSCSIRVLGQIFTDPTVLEFQITPGGRRQTRLVSVTGTVPGQPVEVRGSTTSGRRWLTASPSTGRIPFLAEVTVDPELAPASDAGVVTFGPVVRTIPVRLQSSGTPETGLEAAPRVVDEFVPRGSGRFSRLIRVSNRDGQRASITAQLELLNGASWAAVTPAGGQIPARGELNLQIDFNPANLAPGDYRARLRIRPASGADILIPVGLGVSRFDRLLDLIPSVLSFHAVQGGPMPGRQSLFVAAKGAGAINWNARTEVDAGLPGWLGVSRSSGSSTPGNPTLLPVEVNLTGLPPGIHTGFVIVEPQGSAGSPVVAVVSLTVEAPTTDPRISVSPSGLTFVPPVQGQRINVRNNGTGPVTLEISVQGDPGVWSARLGAGTPVPPGGSAAIDVSANPAGLASGPHRTLLGIRAAGSPLVHTVELLLIVPPGPGRTAAIDGTPRRIEDPTCPAGNLHINSTTVPPGFVAPTGSVLNVEARVSGNDGLALLAGEVTASFGPGSLQLLTTTTAEPGIWRGPLLLAGLSGPFPLRLEARDSIGRSGCLLVGGAAEDAGAPVLSPGGIVSVASFEPAVPLAPGGMIAMFGSGLSTGTQSAAGFPIPARLGATRAVLPTASLDARDARLLFAGPGQVNAILPYRLTDEQYTVVLRRDGALPSNPIAIRLRPNAPAVFMANQEGQGSVTLVDGRTLADSANPVNRGDFVIIYAEGLGEVDPPIANGEQTTLPLRLARARVRVTVGGVESDNVSFAGLAPGFAGLNQINARVPLNAPTGNAIPLVITADDLVSRAVTIAVR